MYQNWAICQICQLSLSLEKNSVVNGTVNDELINPPDVTPEVNLPCKSRTLNYVNNVEHNFEY